MKLSRIDKIIDWGYDPQKGLLNIPALLIRLVTGLYWEAGDLIKIQRGINRGEIIEED
jgi:hypothetical protein